MRVTARADASTDDAACRSHKLPHAIGVGAMMSYHFDPSPTYSAGNVAASWAVAILLFTLMALT